MVENDFSKRPSYMKLPIYIDSSYEGKSSPLFPQQKPHQSWKQLITKKSTKIFHKSDIIPKVANTQQKKGQVNFEKYYVESDSRDSIEDNIKVKDDIRGLADEPAYDSFELKSLDGDTI